MLKALRRRALGPVKETTAGDELRAALKQCRRSLPYLMGVSFFFNILFMASPLYTMQVFDRVISSGRVETLILLTVIAGIALAFMGALEAIRGMLLTRVGRWLERQLAPRLIAWTIRGRLLGLETNAQPLRELGSIRAFVGGTAINAISDLPWSPVFIAVIWLIHPWLAVIAICAAIALFSIALANEFLSRTLMKQAAKQSNESVRRADLAIRNADVFHSMGMLRSFLVSWMDRNEQALEDQTRAADRNAVLYGMSKSIRLFVQILIMGGGAYLVLLGEMTGGGMIAASMLMARSLSPFEQAIGSWKILTAARDAYERLIKALDLVPHVEQNMRLPAPEGRVSCENIIFVPVGRTEPILNGIRFELNGGEVLGILGPSGGGKSTLCRLLVGVSKPSHGHARLDGADLFVWSPEQLGKAVGYLPQDVELFEGKVNSNIARLQPDFDPEAVVEAAKNAGIHEMIMRLPDGYETEIGEAGGFLSGGQRQRIGLARALYGRPKFIVLDEPNASLDAEGEASLIRAIETAKGWGATVVIVAHQPHILKPADKLLVIRNGAMQMFGPRDEVLKNLRVMHEAANGGKQGEAPRQVANQRGSNGLAPAGKQQPSAKPAAKPAPRVSAVPAAPAEPAAAMEPDAPNNTNEPKEEVGLPPPDVLRQRLAAVRTPTTSNS
jgi:PrtD family type I secretion system ABC transporter